MPQFFFLPRPECFEGWNTFWGCLVSKLLATRSASKPFGLLKDQLYLHPPFCSSIFSSTPLRRRDFTPACLKKLYCGMNCSRPPAPLGEQGDRATIDIITTKSRLALHRRPKQWQRGPPFWQLALRPGRRGGVIMIRIHGPQERVSATATRAPQGV